MIANMLVKGLESLSHDISVHSSLLRGLLNKAKLAYMKIPESRKHLSFANKPQIAAARRTGSSLVETTCPHTCDRW